ncbi:DUF1963 domain-containing protein [Macrococcus capreoli]
MLRGIESLTDTENSKLVYIDDVMTNLTLSEIQTYVEQFEYEDEHLPVKGAYDVAFDLNEQLLSPVDYRFEDIAVPLWNKINPEFEIESIYDGYHELMEAVFETLIAEQPAHQLGGYPYFAQEDPREFEEELRVYEQLLLQIDSDEEDGVEIAWGDDGTANVLVKREDLKAMKIDDYIFTWDSL